MFATLPELVAACRAATSNDPTMRNAAIVELLQYIHALSKDFQGENHHIRENLSPVDYVAFVKLLPELGRLLMTHMASAPQITVTGFPAYDEAGFILIGSNPKVVAASAIHGIARDFNSASKQDLLRFIGWMQSYAEDLVKTAEKFGASTDGAGVFDAGGVRSPNEWRVFKQHLHLFVPAILLAHCSTAA